MSESHGLWYFNQWTLEMGGKCYKLSPKDLKFKSINDIWYICRQLESDAENWHKERLEYGFKQETRKVGQTRMMPKEIMTKVDFILNGLHHKCYYLFTANCQNFVLALCSRIAALYTLADVSTGSLTGGTGIGLRNAYLAALAEFAQIAEAGEREAPLRERLEALLPSELPQAQPGLLHELSGQGAAHRAGADKFAGLGHAAMHGIGADSLVVIGAGAAVLNPVAGLALAETGNGPKAPFLTDSDDKNGSGDGQSESDYLEAQDLVQLEGHFLDQMERNKDQSKRTWTRGLRNWKV
ncbi:MAG: hypothetical protein LQ340_001510 [Diploschistes diacapsis]|nr:MAG: hypothetical protein LQ340_001510 [Diploschistes diacapsis]